MNEAQTLLAIENLMKKVMRKTYHWQDLDSEMDHYAQPTESFFRSNREYSPLIQAYFDLQSKRKDMIGDEMFYRRAVFQKFQSDLRTRHEQFVDEFCANNQRNRKSVFKYFDGLIERHCKLLLVRVDLSYRTGHDPSIERFTQDIKRLIKRVQDKDTIFKDQVGYAYRLEQGGESSGYHCHLLVIYNGSVRWNDSYLGMRIGELWKKKITCSDGKFFNCNQSDYRQYHQQKDQWGLGLLERSDLDKRRKAQKMLAYLADPEKDDQYIRGPLLGMRQFRKGQLKKEQRKRKNRRSQKIIDIHHLHEQ
ncbi:YagK/YfjJ domain-containing protein [Acinetobacter indicus]|uniref:YagK/YfjJ domain-containing protein n=1 Tax=Acinetobacter indicus TaxID=756892 RepID=UPI000CEB6C3E|nr:inovirus-type Gp2 protein [Acinetobacter indicus]AVH14901.1 inovirus Gp2 family protein [Acinetobacter indicus]